MIRSCCLNKSIYLWNKKIIIFINVKLLLLTSILFWIIEWHFQNFPMFKLQNHFCYIYTQSHFFKHFESLWAQSYYHSKVKCMIQRLKQESKRLKYACNSKMIKWKFVLKKERTPPEIWNNWSVVNTLFIKINQILLPRWVLPWRWKVHILNVAVTTWFQGT